MTTSVSLAACLDRTVTAELTILMAIPDGPATAAPNRPSGAGWSQREELGHLVDSAVNNHNRIARAAIQTSYEGPGYEQDAWIEAHRYREMRWKELVGVWFAHNRVLVPLVAHIPDSKLGTQCKVGDYAVQTLGHLVDDYVLHMRHHLDQILRRPVVTQYPRA